MVDAVVYDMDTNDTSMGWYVDFLALVFVTLSVIMARPPGYEYRLFLCSDVRLQLGVEGLLVRFGNNAQEVYTCRGL